jgi:DnaJ-class molecular chaperone
MKKSKPKEAVAEIRCPACEGTGFSKVKQPDQPGRRIYPAPCEKCGGKGRVASA